RPILPYPMIAIFIICAFALSSFSCGHHPAFDFLECLLVQFVEELAVERGYSFFDLMVSDDEAGVDGRSAVRDHRYIDPINARKNSRGDAGSVFQLLANQANDRLIALDCDIAQRVEISDDLIEMPSVIKRH